MVQTRFYDEMFIHDAARDAPNYGSRVPVDTTPDPVPVYRAPKNSSHSPCQSAATAGQTQFSALRTTRHLLLHTTGMQQPVLSSTGCNCGSSTVSSTSALVNCRTAQQGHRPPCSATVECPWSNEQFGPWNLPLRYNGEESVLDLHNRDVDNRVQQLGKVYGPTNDLDPERLPLRRERDVDDLDGLQLRRLHSLSSLNMGTMSQLSFWSITAMMSSIVGLPTREKNTARGALSPATPALYMPLQLSFWFLPSMMPSISGLRTREEKTARGALSPAIPVGRRATPPPRCAEWWRTCSCLHHERIRRCRRLIAAPESRSTWLAMLAA